MHVCSTIKNHIGTALEQVQHNMSKLPPTETATTDARLAESVTYHLATGGNKTRALISLYASDALHLRQSDAVIAASIVETLHNASLVHDDIQDHETKRRERDTVWVKYDVGTAICTGDYLISHAYAQCAKISDARKIAELIELVHMAVHETISGQTTDISCDTIATTVAEYEVTAVQKSGPLLALAISIPLLLAGYRRDQIQALIQSCVQPFALSYQIIDDLYDIEVDAQNKTLNLVNLMAQNMSLSEAKLYAINRTELLLNQARAQLKRIPNHAGVYLDYCIDQLQRKAKQVKA
jgi:geranylgeranyl diphosphate synthase type II